MRLVKKTRAPRPLGSGFPGPRGNFRPPRGNNVFRIVVGAYFCLWRVENPLASAGRYSGRGLGSSIFFLAKTTFFFMRCANEALSVRGARPPPPRPREPAKKRPLRGGRGVRGREARYLYGSAAREANRRPAAPPHMCGKSDRAAAHFSPRTAAREKPSGGAGRSAQAKTKQNLFGILLDVMAGKLAF